MTWTKEDRLLLFCCRTGKDDRNWDEIVEKQRDKIDWVSFLEKARGEGISPLVFLRLPKIVIDKEDIPPYVTEELEKDYYLNATRNTLIFNELGNILHVFNEGGLQVIVLKGAALAETAYGNLALRPLLDIDLLVKKEDLFSIDEKLKGLGYFPSDRSVDDIDFSSTYLTTLDYRNTASNPLSFHIHWHFVNSTVPNEHYINDIKMEDIWKEAKKATIANAETLVMAPYHLIIHLSEHAFRVTHSFGKLSFFCDINEAINYYKERLDWERLLEYSIKFKLDRMVYISLHFTSNFLAADIPEDILLKLSPKCFTMGEKVFMNAISKNDRIPGLSYLVHLSMNKGLFKKMRFVGRTFFPPRQIVAQRIYTPQSKVNCSDYFLRINEVFSRLFDTIIILGKGLRKKGQILSKRNYDQKSNKFRHRQPGKNSQ